MSSGATDKRLLKIKSWPKPMPSVASFAVSEKLYPARIILYSFAFPVFRAILALICSFADMLILW
ncbi:hypothetical protein D3C71_1749790 [compost metagenome]